MPSEYTKGWFRLSRFFTPWVIALAAMLPGGCADEPSLRPVILVVIDTLRKDHLSFHGYDKETSPGIDGLAEESVVFERCIAPSSWTKPSTASLLSGLDPLRHTAHRNRSIAKEARLLSEILQDAGYATAAFSGNPYVSAKFHLDQGFDTFYEGGGQNPKDYPDITVLLNEARAWLAEPPPEPFFLYLHVMNVHGPYRAPPEYRERFRNSAAGEGKLPFQGKLWWSVMGPGRTDSPEPSPGQRADLLARYDGAIAYSDEKLVQFLEELRSDGRLDRCLLIITSDHGEELLDHGGLGHRRTLYSEAIDVPLIVRNGGHCPGRRVETPVGLIDVAATILDLAGVAPGGMPFGDGVSLGPLVRGDGEIARSTPLLSHLQEERLGSATLLQQWPLRLLRIKWEYTGRKDVVELYDEIADPGETRDLSAGRPNRVRELTELEEAVHTQLRALAIQPGADVKIDPKLQERLEELGYTGK